jgi:hypothetical protein
MDFHDFESKSQMILRVNVEKGQIENIAGVSDLQSLDYADFRFVGLAPGDVPLLRARTTVGNLYEAQIEP